MLRRRKALNGDISKPVRQLLYETLKANGLGDAHLTDISKEIGSGAAEISPAERKRNRPYFERELEIVEPTTLVAVGEQPEQELEWIDATREFTLFRVNHYSWAGRWGKEETFKQQIRSVAEQLGVGRHEDTAP